MERAHRQDGVDGQSCFGFLRKNRRINSCDTNSAAYITLVRLHLEYCATSWCLHTVQSKQKLEMVKRRAARYRTNRYHNTSSDTDMLQNLNFETLESRRTKRQLVTIYTRYTIYSMSDSVNKDKLITVQSRVII